MNSFKLILALMSILSLTGCADITLPTPKEIIQRPIGTDSVKIGMSRNEVKEIWGVPDQVNQVEDKELWGGQRTEWVYRGRYSAVPVDAGFLSRTKKLYFDGDNLTNIVDVKEE